GLRVLLVVRRFYRDNPARQYQVVDNLMRSAASFGLVAREFSSWTPPPGVAVADYAAALRAEIEAGAPQLIVFDDLLERGLSVDPTVGPQIAALVVDVRRRLGIPIVKMLADGWIVPADRFHRGLGEHYDLLNHCHPAARGHGGAAERAATFCFPFPFAQPTPTAPTHGIARACFVGTVNAECPGRLAWWAEAVRAGVPLDVFLADHGGAVQRSDLDYVNLLHGYQLSVNLTRRHTGIRILTGRSIETPLSGGLLLEEDSEDTRYFLTPGTHYEPFDTLGQLVARVPELLAEPAHCRKVAAAGEAWVKRWFSGDCFWAGVLDRLGLAA
ncbi:MAG: glycosyltransferase family 1 protein, partial [Alphaproteobacteria bacterium]|nr:glycosyltransferase family 1 protein [Alphaproteobacteria bacterium]